MIQARIEPLKAIILDVDGVLTDGRVRIDPTGREIKVFHTRDGIAHKWLMEQGFHLAWLSGRSSVANESRAAALGVRHLLQGMSEKLTPYGDLKKSLGVTDEEVCFMGDDLLDLPVMTRAGFAVTVADAPAEVRDVAHHVTSTPGGGGAVRELAELVLKSRGLWQDVMKTYTV